MSRYPIYLRWSLRDLRGRWLQVAAIAVIVALGTGLYASLDSITTWRTVSQPASYARANMFDVRVQLSQGSYRPPADLERAARSASNRVNASEARLIAPTQIDASTDDRTILIPGRIVGIPLGSDAPGIAEPVPSSGRGLTGADTGRNTVTLDQNFLKFYGLSAPFPVTASGGSELQVVGGSLAPEYFTLTGNQGNILGVSNFAVVFTSIETAQRLDSRPGLANDVLVTALPGTDRDLLAADLQESFARAFPDLGVTTTTRDQDATFQLLARDIDSDQRFYVVFSVIILLGAAFAAFNLTGRIVESQRREIGIGLALGERPRRLAIRPLLVGLEVAALGAILGIILGAVFGWALSRWVSQIFLLPEWRFPMNWASYLRAAALGFILPVLATLWPVWRAVRVQPIDAIHTGPTSTGSGGLAPLLARLPLPRRRSMTLLPVRNVVRAPRRTLMTALGIGAAVVLLVSVIGMLDSFYSTIDVADRELTRDAPDRLTVALSGFSAVDDPTVTAVVNASSVGTAEPQLEIGGQAVGDITLDLLIELVSPDSAIWTPTVRDAVPNAAPGIVLTEKAARDLGVRPGDSIQLRHPKREGLASYRIETSEVPVLGLSPIPTRFVAFMPPSAARLMGLEGIVNTVIVNPKPGLGPEAVQRELFGQPGVASVQPVAAFTNAIKAELNQSLGFLNIVRGAVLLLALLIAFNTASINTDERARDHATMFAFGMRLRTLLRMNVIEGFLLGLLGTTIGLVAGWFLLGWILDVILGSTLPDVEVLPRLAPGTILTAFALGVVAVAVAPIFTIRKLRRMDIPATLRVVE